MDEILKKDIIEKIKKTCPALEWSELTYWNSTYGHYYFGIGDGFIWDEEALNNANLKELWKIYALCSEYWRNYYEEKFNEEANYLQKVYVFARECRKYIHLDDTSYESNFTMLSEALKFIKEKSK